MTINSIGHQISKTPNKAHASGEVFDILSKKKAKDSLTWEELSRESTRFTESQETDYRICFPGQKIVVDRLNTCHGAILINKTKGIVCGTHVFVGRYFDDLFHMPHLNRLYPFKDIVNDKDDIVAVVFGNGVNEGPQRTTEYLVSLGIKTETIVDKTLGGMVFDNTTHTFYIERRHGPIDKVDIKSIGDIDRNSFGVKEQEIKKKYTEIRMYEIKTIIDPIQNLFTEFSIEQYPGGILPKLFHLSSLLRKKFIESKHREEKRNIMTQMREVEDCISSIKRIISYDLYPLPYLPDQGYSKKMDNESEYVSLDGFSRSYPPYYTIFISKAADNTAIVSSPFFKENIILSPGSSVSFNSKESKQRYQRYYQKYRFDSLLDIPEGDDSLISFLSLKRENHEGENLWKITLHYDENCVLTVDGPPAKVFEIVS